nr:YqzE family protein [Bacillus amyloliquefaciens]MDH3090731.1 YqzE family protein [Bacillus amyloliquefaciens]
MKTNDYVKYMTEQFVKYFDTPKQERKERKEVRKEKESAGFSALVRNIAVWF